MKIRYTCVYKRLDYVLSSLTILGMCEGGEGGRDVCDMDDIYNVYFDMVTGVSSRE